MRKTDRHIHTPFCPHGSTDSFEQYIEHAIELGFQEISFTEHAPLPENFNDPTPDKDSGMEKKYIDEYISRLQKLKEDYLKYIYINVGLEVDFIEGYEHETSKFLNEYGPYLDDSILSVHFLKRADSYFCLDFSPEEFERMISIYGSLDNIYEAYYSTISKSVIADLGIYKPKRIGHVTLVHKFHKRFPRNLDDFEKNSILNILDSMKDKDMELDYNAAGLFKALCKEPYPPDWVVTEAEKRKIPLIFGSDAHCAKDLGQGYNSLF